MAEQASVHFKQLEKIERQSRFSRISSVDGGQILVWCKGSKKKYFVDSKIFFRETQELEINGKLPNTVLDASEILFNFEINGMNFFGKTTIQEKMGKLILDCSQDVFKSERRNNFRLLTYPHHQVTIQIKVSEEVMEPGNVIDFKTRLSETGIFQDFLELIEESSEDLEGGLVKFIVTDISVTGLAFRFGDFEKNFFPESENEIELGEMILDFNGEKVTIPGGHVRYIREAEASNKKKYYQAGMLFTNVNTNLDDFLGKKINTALRNVESEFEDFIK